MIHDLISDIRAHFQRIPNRSAEEQALLDRLNEGYFPITTVHRDDLASKGFDVRNISDSDMEALTSKMASAYCDNFFWEDMVIIAGDMDLPKNPCCPKCGYHVVTRDNRTHSLCCNSCDQKWSESYTLVDNPEETDRLPDDPGYPSSESLNSNARYIPESDYIRIFGKAPQPNSYYEPVCWPESQKYMPEEDEGDDSTNALNELINDEKGLAEFGDNAYWVAKCNLK